MFAPGDPRYEEILDLANLATLDLLLDSQRPRWRELVTQEIPVGTVMELSIKVAGRKVPLLVRAQVVRSKPGELAAAFIDLFQNDRELLEGIAVKALLGGP